jgi:hypothetical protein
MAQKITETAAEIECANSESDSLDYLNVSREGSIYNRLKGYLPGIGKWKRVACVLFQLKVLHPFLIR